MASPFELDVFPECCDGIGSIREWIACDIYVILRSQRL